MSTETVGRLALATRFLEASSERPGPVVQDASALLDGPVDDEAASVALRARALARRALGDLSGAIDDLTRAVRVADDAGLRGRAGEARMSLVVALADAGRTAEALAESDRARPLLSGANRSRLLAQRALVLARTGRSEEALRCYRDALPGIRRAGDTWWEALVLGNRGPLRAYLGDHRGAADDLTRAAEVARAEGYTDQLARARQNLGFATCLTGDVPRALALLDEADAVFARIGADPAPSLMDRAEALLCAGLGDEAARCANTALASLEDRGLAYDAAEAGLLLARSSLLAGRPVAALHAAGLAANAFTRQRRPAWTRLARQVMVAARWETGERGPDLVRAATRAADDCDRAGWSVASLESRLIAARAGSSGGHPASATRALRTVAAARRGPGAQARAMAWHATALLRVRSGDRSGARRALRRGLDVLGDYAAALGATDLRTSAAGFGGDLAALGLRLAVEDGRARAVLTWAEKSRATALRAHPARPPDDDRLAELLGRLRSATSRVREAALDGRDVTALQQQRSTLEDAVRDLARHARGAGARDDDRLSVAALAEALGDRVLVELVRDGDQLLAVTLSRGRARMVGLGAYDEVADETTALRFALSRLAHPTTTPRAGAMAERGRDVAAARLAALLLHPLGATLSDARQVVVVPTGALHAVPWSTLPGLRDKAVTIAPSALLWLRAAGSGRAERGHTLLAAGPALDHAADEVAALSRLYPAATVLTGPAATADATRTAMDGAELAHVAAHGHFRGDNPQFSALDLHDGPLTVYDLERLRRAPSVLVLSACDSGLSGVKPGDELMGLAAAVMALGTRTLVASVVPVADAPTRPYMEALHARLLAGESPAAALATTTAETGLDGFVCFGAG